MVDLSIVIIFLLANLVIGWIARHKITNMSHFAVGNRSFKSVVICMTLSATFIGGGYTIGNAAKVYETSMIYAFALLGFSLKEILVGCFIAPRMKHYTDCYSVGDIMGRKYGKAAQIITGVFAVIICAGILGAQVGAVGALVKTFFNLSVLWGIIIGFGVMIIYSMLGGMFAVVYTDVLQFVILIIGIPLVFIVGLIHFGGWHDLMAKLPVGKINFLHSGHHLPLFISLFITFMVGETLVPPYVQRLLMSKNVNHTKRGVIASGVISIPFFLIAGMIGLIAFAMNPHLDARGANEALPYVVKTLLPIGLRGLVIASIAAVLLSSAAGFLNAGVIALINDIVVPLKKNARFESSKFLILARITTVLIGVGAIFFALAIPNVLDILLYAYNFWAPIILVPLLAAIFTGRGYRYDFFVGAIFGIIFVMTWFFGLHEPYGISAVVIGVLGNVIGFILSRVSRGSLQFITNK